MSIHLLRIILLAASITTAFTFSSKLPLPSKTIYQFPLGTWIENVVARSNGNLLLTILSPAASLYSLNPHTSDPTPELIHTFTNVTSLLGITETKPDIFALIAGNFSNSAGHPGSFSVWSVDLTPRNPKPKIRKIVSIPEADLLNGIAYLLSPSPSLLIADSSKGVIWAVNPSTGSYSIALQISELLPPANSSLAFGINGIRIHSRYLYWTNSGSLSIFRAKLNPIYTEHGINPLIVGKVERIAHPDALFLDDFAIDEKGTVWVCTTLDNRLLAVSPRGEVATVLGEVGEFTVAGDTAAAFGRAKEGGKTEMLYVVTGGAAAAPVNGTGVEGGKVVGVDTRGFRF